MDQIQNTLVWTIAGNGLLAIVCGVMFYRADKEAIRLYNLKYSEKHSDEERAAILARMKKRLQWFYGFGTLLSTGFLMVNLIVVLRR